MMTREWHITSTWHVTRHAKVTRRCSAVCDNTWTSSLHGCHCQEGKCGYVLVTVLLKCSEQQSNEGVLVNFNCHVVPKIIIIATYSTSKKGNVTVFQKSYPYSHVILKKLITMHLKCGRTFSRVFTLKCSSHSSSISGLYWIVIVFHM